MWKCRDSLQVEEDQKDFAGVAISQQTLCNRGFSYHTGVKHYIETKKREGGGGGGEENRMLCYCLPVAANGSISFRQAWQVKFKHPTTMFLHLSPGNT